MPFTTSTRILAPLLALVLTPTFASALPIDVISTTYSVAGSGIETVTGGTLFSFSETSDQPIFRGEGAEFLDDQGQSGVVVVTTLANGGITSDGAWLETDVFSIDHGFASVAESFASASLTFQPRESNFLLGIGHLGGSLGDGWTQSAVSLYDETTGTMIGEWRDGHLGGMPFDQRLSLDPSHIYTLLASTDPRAADPRISWVSATWL